MKTIEVIALVILVIWTICFLAALETALANAEATDRLRIEAVERGFAEWRVINARGKTEFVWREKEGE